MNSKLGTAKARQAARGPHPVAAVIDAQERLRDQFVFAWL
jgi:hypothetical protein